MDEDFDLQQAFIQSLIKLAYNRINEPYWIPQSVKDAKQEYLDETDVVKLFIDN